MAPASHLCDSPPKYLTSSELERLLSECERGGGGSSYGRHAPLTSMLQARQASQFETGPNFRRVVYPDSTPPKSVLKEPAFIAAIVLTAAILLGGILVTKLSNSRLPRRKSSGQGGLLERSPDATPPGPSTHPSSLTTTTLTAGSPQPLAPAPDRFCPLPTPEYTPSPLFHSVTASQCDIAGASRLATPPPEIKEGSHLFGSAAQVTASDSSPQEPSFSTRYLSEEDVDDIRRATTLELVPSALAATCSESKPSLRSRRESWPHSMHPREGSEESHTTDTSIPGDLFSSSSNSLTSVTSSSECPSDVDDDESGADDIDPEIIFEVKRGQTQSLELVKGVLLSLPRSSSSTDIADLREVSSLQRKRAEACLKVSQTAPTIPVPALIVTQPSTLSLFTVASSTSNMSMELGKFPLPPLHLEPAVFWQKLEDEINTSLALKRRSKV